jgi:hypothetical protein
MNKAELRIIINILDNLKREIQYIGEREIDEDYNLKYIDKDIELLKKLVGGYFI